MKFPKFKVKTTEYIAEAILTYGLAFAVCLFIVAAIVVTPGCATSKTVATQPPQTVSVEPSPSPAPQASPSPTVKRDWPEEGWQPEYSAHISQNLTAEMIASNPQTNLCPGYDTSHGDLAKAQWVNILKAISYAECGWDRTQDYEESFIDDVTGELAISAGLFQMSVSDDLYEGCQFKTKAGLYDPIINIDCALRTMSRLIRVNVPDQTVMNALAHYWATTDLVKPGNREATCTMLKKLKSLDSTCKVSLPSVCQ